MNDSAKDPKPASKKQIKYLKDLAVEKGRSFAWPATSADADRQIKQLLAAPSSSRQDRGRERRQVQEDMARRSGGAARVRDSELRGYGSSASWAGS